MYIMPETYIIPDTAWKTIYALQEVSALLIIFSMIVYVILESKYTKYIITTTLLLITGINYTIIAMLTKYETINILPLVIIETSHGYSTTSIDFGQISIIILAIIWRKQLYSKTRQLYKKLKTLKTKPIKTTQKLETKKEEAAVV